MNVYLSTYELVYIHMRLILINKPRTAKVGAISKAQNCKRGNPSGFVKLQLVAKNEKKIDPFGGPFGNLKNFSEKFQKMRFLNSVTVPKNVKGGTLWDFLTSILLQNIETNEGGTLWCNPKRFKKSIIVPKKKWGYGASLV